MSSYTIFDNPERLKCILNESHPDSFGENLKKSFEEEKSYYSKADRIICLSDYMKKILCSDYGLDTTKISVVPNGLTDQGFQKIAGLARNDARSSGCNDDIIQMRKKWHIPSSEKIIFFAGRLDEVKGVSYLIKAFREVLNQYSNCRLIIAGSGDFDKYMREAKELSAKISFTGLLDRNDLYEIYQIANVGVVPSLFEPFGYVAVEMMMHKLSVVATSTSGLNEVVDESCGLKIPITVLPDSVEVDVSILAKKIVYLLQNPVEAKQFGRNGRKRYLEKYTSKVFRNNMLKLYQAVCSEDDSKIKTLIITGQNSHHWEISHFALKQILENSGLFTVDVAISPVSGGMMSNFKPDFASYQLVVLDYTGDRWPEETENSFFEFC